MLWVRRTRWGAWKRVLLSTCREVAARLTAILPSFYRPFPRALRSAVRHAAPWNLHSGSIPASLLFLFFANAAAAQSTFYIDSAATDFSNGLTWANAWRNFNEVDWGLITPGATIYISGGSTSKTYVGKVDILRSGFPGQPITIRTGQTPGHNGRVIQRGRWDFNDSAWVTLDGSLNGQINMEITDSTSSGMYSERPVGLKILYIESHHNGTADNHHGVRFNAFAGHPFEAIIAYCHIHDNFVDGINSNRADGVAYGELSIHHNIIERNGDDGIQVTAGVDIFNNIIRDRRSDLGPGHADGFQGVGSYIRYFNNITYDISNALFFIETTTNSAGHWRIYNNLFYIDDMIPGNSRAIELAAKGPNGGGQIPVVAWDDIVVANNTFVNIADHFSFHLGAKATVTTLLATNVKIINNIFVDGYSLNETGQALQVGSSSAESDLVVENNVVTGPNTLINYRGTIYPNAEALNAATSFSGNTSARPVFIDEGANDYHLAPEDTVARDQGADLSAYFTVDQDGIPRPQGGAWDRGPYEGAGEPDTELPSTPTLPTAQAISSFRIDVAWFPSTDNIRVQGYIIYRDGVAVGTSASNLFSDTGLAASTTYTYRISAFDPTGNESGLSIQTQATTLQPDVTRPTTPTNLIGLSNSPYSVALSWSFSTDDRELAGYQISLETLGTDIIIGQTELPGFVAGELTPETTYVFVVHAVDAAGNLSIPARVTVVTKTAPLPGAGLVAAYSFDEESGGVLNDYSGFDNHGQVVMAGGPKWVEGKYCGGLDFNGSGDWVIVSDDASLDLSSGMTLEAWVFPTGPEDRWQHLVAKQLGGVAAYYIAGRTSIGLPWSGFNIGGEWKSSGGGVPAPMFQWSHISSTYDGNTLIIYVNGSRVGSLEVNAAIESSNDPLHIGGNILGEFFEGRIDDVRIYNRPLDPQEIVIDMNTPVDPVCSPPPPSTEVNSRGLLLAYDLNEGTGVIARDVSRSGNDGLITGATYTSGDGGRFGEALQFDGTGGDYINMRGFDIVSEAMTIEFWFKANNFAVVDARFISKSNGLAENDHFWMVSTDTGPKLRFRLKTTTGVTKTLIANSGILSPGRWIHVAATYDARQSGGLMNLYKDGILVGSLSHTGLIAVDPLTPAWIGDTPAGDPRPFNGLIDEVHIYDRALSSSEILENMNNPFTNLNRAKAWAAYR